MTDIGRLATAATSPDLTVVEGDARAVNGAADEPFTRLRRTLERVRGNLDRPQSAGLEDENDLRLELMLLREENTRLKVAAHRPPELGAMIDHLRALAAEHGEAEVDDELWGLLADILATRESLEQACVEIETAVGAVRRRLHRLSPELDAIDTEALDGGDVVVRSQG